MARKKVASEKTISIRDRIKRFDRVPASQVAPSPYNWRNHPARQQEALRGVLEEIGFAGAVLVRELKGGKLEAIDGHLRLETMGAAEVPVLVTDLSESEAKTILATYDPLGAMAESNKDKLDALLREVQTESEAIASMLGELAAEAGCDWAKPEAGAGGDEFDATPDESGPTCTNVGELWEIEGGHRLLVGDCTVAANVERLMGGEKAEMMWTDPPYGVDYVGKTKDALKIQNDGAAGLPKLLDGAFASAMLAVRPGGAWYVAAPPGPLHWEFAKRLMDLGVYRQTLVWVKDSMVLGHSDYHYKHEPIFYGWSPGAAHREMPDRSQVSVWEIARPKRNEDHPTMKPIELVQKAVANSSGDGELVLDPFLGSGTTLIAAHRLGRRCYGMEIEPRYADVILRRAEAENLKVKRLK